MKKSECVKKGFLYALGSVVYIALVAWFLSNGENFFGKEENFVIPLFLLLLFVISATIVGFLVLGKPVRLYIEGMKKEAIFLLFSTLGWLVFFLVCIIVWLVISHT